jgi:NhaC family Na+:H+ antiporter
MTTKTEQKKIRPAFLWEAFIPVVALVVMIRESLVRYEGAAHIPLLLAAAIAALVGMRAGHRWQDIEQGIIDGVSVGLKPILILLVVGMLIGTWIASGIVPILIYHGLNLLNHQSSSLPPALFVALSRWRPTVRGRRRALSASR